MTLRDQMNDEERHHDVKNNFTCRFAWAVSISTIMVLSLSCM